MAISQTMNNALSGLRATMLGTELSASNIANANTEGYGVRNTVLSTRILGGNGAGVQVTGIHRESDPFLVARRRLADAEFGASTEQVNTLKAIETLLTGHADGDSLSDHAVSVENALIEASADPASEPRLTKLANRIEDFVSKIRSASQGLDKLRENADQTIAKQTAKLNSTLKEVDRLNDEIIRTQQNSGESSGLIDQRQQLVDQISQIVPVQQLAREGGRIALISSQGELLLDHRLREITFQHAGSVSGAMTLGNGALSDLMIDGDPVSGKPGVGNLAGGSLGAAFETRDHLVPNAAAKLDQIATDLVARFSDPTQDPTISSDGLIVLDSSNSGSGVAGRLKVNPLIKGNPAVIRDGLNSTSTQNTGDPTILGNWVEALADSSSLGGGPARSLSGHLRELETQSSSRRVDAEDLQARHTATRNAYLDREKASGVDTDMEMQKLLQLEKAYAANAKVIQVADRLLTQLLEI